MHAGAVSQRRWHSLRPALCLCAVGAISAVGAVAAAQASQAALVPRVLTQPALQSPKALLAATLAVTRAGQRLVAVGERGTVLWSDNAGLSWQQAQVPVQVTLTAVHFVDARTGWAVGHLGVILKTEDAGQTWTLQLDGVRAALAVADAARTSSDERVQHAAQRFDAEGPDKPFLDVDFSDAQHGFAVGAYNLAFATVDGGKTWTPALDRLPNAKNLHLYGVRYVGGHVFVVGEQGLLLKSTDAGSTFVALASPYKGSFFGLLAARSGTLLAYGLRGHVLRSADQGAHWDDVQTGVPRSFSGAVELDGGALALLSQTGDLLLSRDDGRTVTAIAPQGGPLPACGAAAVNGQLVLASLRGLRRQTAP